MSYQEQRALEEVAGVTSATASALLMRAAQNGEIDEDRLKAEYSLLIAGAMRATAQIRAAYLQSFARAAREQPFTIPQRVLAPLPEDVLLPGVNPAGAVNNVIVKRSTWMKEMQSTESSMREAIQEGVARSATALDSPARRAALEADLRARVDQMAASRLGSLAESTMMSTADFVQREVLGPDQRIVALRRVTHPSACDRCTQVAKILVFKRSPSLRHDQCRCSFEPVFRSDPEYQKRLALYRRNSVHREISGPGGARYARDVRYRGRRQLERARLIQDSETYQASWSQLLSDEQKRLSDLVKTIPSNSFKNWAVMVSANQAEAGGGLLPVLTRR